MERKEGIARYIWRHRVKVASVVALAMGAAVAYSFMTAPKPDDDEQQSSALRPNDGARSDPTDEEHKTSVWSPPALRALREMLKAKVVEAVDVAGAVRRIKESTKSSHSRPESTPARLAEEARLWEHVKVSCLTVFFLAVYATVAVELHAAADAEQVRHFLFERGGLDAFTDELRRRVTEVCAAWTVREKVEVSFHEVEAMVAQVRRSLPPAAATALLFPSPVGVSTASASASFAAALDATFRLALDGLRSHAFMMDEDRGGGPVSPLRGGGGGPAMRTPPLASLLPQLNGVAQRLLTSGAVLAGRDAQHLPVPAPTGRRDRDATPSSPLPPCSPARRTGEGHVGFVVRVLQGGGEKEDIYSENGPTSPLRFTSDVKMKIKMRGPDSDAADDGAHTHGGDMITDWALKFV